MLLLKKGWVDPLSITLKINKVTWRCFAPDSNVIKRCCEYGNIMNFQCFSSFFPFLLMLLWAHLQMLSYDMNFFFFWHVQWSTAVPQTWICLQLWFWWQWYHEQKFLIRQTNLRNLAVNKKWITARFVFLHISREN